MPSTKAEPGYSRLPGATDKTPGGSGPQGCGSSVPSFPGRPRSSLSARRARSLRRASRAKRAEPSGARWAAAQAAAIAARALTGARQPVDARTMAAEGPGPRARLWTAALFLLGLPRLSVRADGECPRSAWEAAGTGGVPGVWVGKAELTGVPIRTSPENRKPGREGGERRCCNPASSPGPRSFSSPKCPHCAPNPSFTHRRKPEHWSRSPAASFPKISKEGLYNEITSGVP